MRTGAIVTGDLKRTFTQSNFLFVRSIKGLLINNNNNGEPVHLPNEVMETYKNDIDMEKLKLHLQLLLDATKLVNLNEVPVKRAYTV